MPTAFRLRLLSGKNNIRNVTCCWAPLAWGEWMLPLVEGFGSDPGATKILSVSARMEEPSGATRHKRGLRRPNHQIILQGQRPWHSNCCSQTLPPVAAATNREHLEHCTSHIVSIWAKLKKEFFYLYVWLCLKNVKLKVIPCSSSHYSISSFLDKSVSYWWPKKKSEPSIPLRRWNSFGQDLMYLFPMVPVAAY